MNTELLDFTRRALEQGVSRERIAAALKDAGWSDADIRAADGAFATADFPVPVPRPRPYLSAREVFIYALFFTALYVSAWNAGASYGTSRRCDVVAVEVAPARAAARMAARVSSTANDDEYARSGDAPSSASAAPSCGRSANGAFA